MEYEESFCCLDAEFDTIWSKDFLRKKEKFKMESAYIEPPDISHLHQDWWMFDDIPF